MLRGPENDPENAFEPGIGRLDGNGAEFVGWSGADIFERQVLGARIDLQCGMWLRDSSNVTVQSRGSEREFVNFDVRRAFDSVRRKEMN